MYKALIKPFAKDIKEFFLDTLFPISCLGCGQEGEFVCELCKSQLIFLDQQKCIVCQKQSFGGITHSGCKTPQAPEGVISFLDYRDPKVAKIIIHGKYFFLRNVYKILGKLMNDKIKIHNPHLIAKNFYLAPIPLAKAANAGADLTKPKF